MNSIGKIGKIIITEELKKQIDYYHKKVGSTEWSGMLFYKHTGGDISKLKDLEFTAFSLFLMDIGSHSYTEFEYDKDIIKAYNLIPDAIESNSGIIHTHHTMNAFFSGTDTKELEENAKKYNYFLSLIVCFDEEYSCKVVFPSTSKITSLHTIRNTNGEFVEVSTNREETILLVGDLEVELTSSLIVEDWVSKRLEEIKTKKAEKAKKVIPSYKGFSNVGSYPKGNYFGRYDPTDEVNCSERFNTPTYPTRAERAEEFAIALLMGANDSTFSLEEALSASACMGEEDTEMFIDILDQQIEILHSNVYKSNFLFEKHIEEATEVMERCQLGEKEKEIVELIKTYAIYES